jgi:predicted nucleic acid-binding Zn ribbon protein
MVMVIVLRGEIMRDKVVCSQKCRKIERQRRKEERGGGVREKKREKEVRR